jgi:cytochrome c-type biogenesis protein
MSPSSITVPVAFLAGLLSFISPCVLPLVPVYLSYLTGSSLEGEARPQRWMILRHALLFVGGFTLVFVLLFGAPMGLLGSLLVRFAPVLVRVGGLFLILLGLHTTRLIRLPLPSLERGIRWGQDREPSPLRSVGVGMTLAIGWVPCVGPLLGAIMTLALQAQAPLRSAFYLLTYSLGMGVPFLLVAILLTRSTRAIRRLNRHLNLASLVSGLFLILVGLLLITGLFQRLNSLFLGLTPGWLIEWL